MSDPLFTSDPDVMGGRRVFRGTRIPVEVLFENLADGMSLDEVLDAYPGLRREDAIAAIERACESVKGSDETRSARRRRSTPS
jgi:uncharacterized protein (DUF433 family)